MSATEAPLLAARELGYAYPGRPVLRDVTLAVQAGEVVGVLGPNGAGKSTLVRLVSGVLRGYVGSLRVAGEEVRGLARRRLARLVAVVPQESSFGFPFSALEVVLMGRHPHLAGLAFEGERDVALAFEALQRCGAAELAGRRIQELSAGERQRVLVARALAQEPRLLLLDEAGSFMDIRHQVETYDLVRAVAAGGAGVLAILHDLNLAAEYCDRVVLLAGGGVAAQGPTAEVFTYANLTRVFATELYVDTNDLTGRLVVTPLSGRARQRLGR
jgi:iron complex transport system ATP-binding protein